MTATLLSQELLLAVRSDKPVEPLLSALGNLSGNALINDLTGINERKSFWLNIYNSFLQIKLQHAQPALNRFVKRIRFFSKKNILIAGQHLSLNDIEHGILRYSSIWWSMGHLRKINPSSFEKLQRVHLDYRIHFALNCGASSCPPIAFYQPLRLDTQLNEAMYAFLESDIVFNHDHSQAMVSAIFKWYNGDFGGTSGIVGLISNHFQLKNPHKLRITYKPYDWHIRPKYFAPFITTNTVH